MPFRGFDRLIGFRGQADWPPNPIQHAVETTMVIEVASQTRKTEQKPQSAQVQDAQASEKDSVSRPVHAARCGSLHAAGAPVFFGMREAFPGFARA
jgi:hypothetical protein